MEATLHGEDTRRALAKLDGVDLTGPYTGLLSVAGRTADMLLEADDTIRLAMPVSPLDGYTALVANHHLPGNVRFAIHRRSSQLVADTQLDGRRHLKKTFSLIATGFGLAQRSDGDHGKADDAEKEVTPDRLQQAVDELKWEDQAVVQQDYGWELRVRIAGEVAPVRLESVSGSAGVRLHRVVSESLPDEGSIPAAAVGDLALRLNGRLRQVHLARAGEQLVCEARLHDGLLQGSWLSMTAQAVAVACRHAGLLVRVLAEHGEIAETYMGMFDSCVQETVLCGAAN